MNSRSLRVAIFGAGFWARYQIAAWREVGGVKVDAIYNRTRSKAEALARALPWIGARGGLFDPATPPPSTPSP